MLQNRSCPQKHTEPNMENVCLSVREYLQCVYLFSLVCVVFACVYVCTITSTGLHTLLAATFHRLLYVLCDRGPIITFEGQPAAANPQGGAAGGGSSSGRHVWVSSSLAPASAFDPREGLGRLAEDGATLHSVVIPDWLTSTWGLCRSELEKHTNGNTAHFHLRLSVK